MFCVMVVFFSVLIRVKKYVGVELEMLVIVFISVLLLI